MRSHRFFSRMAGWKAGVLMILAASGIGCESAEEFRSVASSAIQSGVTSIATGVIDGLFAVFTPDMTDTTGN